METHFIKYFSDIKSALDKVDLNIFKEINKLIFNTLKDGTQIFTMGNGGSGMTASHFVCDLNKGIGFGKNKKFKCISLVDNLPILMAYANDLSYSDIFCEQLKNFMNEKDIVIGFSGSGNSENVIKAIEFANKKGAVTVGFSGFNGGKLSEIVMYSIIVPIYDMQKSEDIHLILSHLIMQTMERMLKSKNG